MTQTYLGTCHCGRVRFELEAKIERLLDCNCSICRRRGALWIGAHENALHIVSGETDLQLYQFHTHTAKHYFCSHCGIHPFARPRINPAYWVVNARCIDNLDLASYSIDVFDGLHWEDAAKAFLAQRKAQ